MISKYVIKLTILPLIVWFTIIAYLNLKHPDQQWNWDKIDTEKMFFPKNFIWGTSTAAHQVEGNNTNNNWYEWENSLNQNGKANIHNNDKSGEAARHWDMYRDDISLMNELGVNAYRFSVEWSKIIPEEGLIDEKALVKALVNKEIAGAGLDVFETEPNLPNELKTMENVVSFPHLGSATIETRLAMGNTAIENTLAFFAGTDLPNKVV